MTGDDDDEHPSHKPNLSSDQVLYEVEHNSHEAGLASSAEDRDGISIKSFSFGDAFANFAVRAFHLSWGSVVNIDRAISPVPTLAIASLSQFGSFVLS